MGSWRVSGPPGARAWTARPGPGVTMSRLGTGLLARRGVDVADRLRCGHVGLAVLWGVGASVPAAGDSTGRSVRPTGPGVGRCHRVDAAEQLHGDREDQCRVLLGGDLAHTTPSPAPTLAEHIDATTATFRTGTAPPTAPTGGSPSNTSGIVDSPTPPSSTSRSWSPTPPAGPSSDAAARRLLAGGRQRRRNPCGDLGRPAGPD